MNERSAIASAALQGITIHNTPELPENSIPARVLYAIRFSRMMAERAGPIVAISAERIEEFASAPVTKTEQEAWDRANKLIADYFGDSYLMDEREQVLHRMQKIEVESRSPGKLMICWRCNGGGREPGRRRKGEMIPCCELCRGHGTLNVQTLDG